MLTFILEAAFRSLLMALAVWTTIRLLRVQAVLAQKVAWVLVLLAAGAMPLVMRAPFLALDKAMRIPIRPLTGGALQSPRSAPVEQAGISLTSPSKITQSSRIPKPSTSHLMDPIIDSSISSSDEPEEVPAQFAQSPALASDLPTSTISATSSLTAPIDPADLKRNSTQAANPFWSWVRVKSVVFTIYLAVGCLLLLRMLIGLAIAFRIWHRARPIAELPLGVAVPENRIVRVSRDLTTPVTIGLTVILPSDYLEWDEAKLRVVLAHEGSHVRQGDFYLQLLAALHVAVFWFSPLGWWLQRKLSELGEALSDRDGLEQAQSPASYARILLEFAAMPRTKSYLTPLAGVAMARSSNLSSRIERVLNDRRFRIAFVGGRRHAVVAALLVPAALIAVVACIRIVPAVEAAQAQTTAPVAGQVSGSVADQVTTVNVTPPAAPDATEAPAPAPVPDPLPAMQVAPTPAPEAESPAVPEPESVQAPVPPISPKHPHGFSYSYSIGNDDGGSFAIVRGNNNTMTMSGNSGEGLERAREKYHDNFIWFERDGKSYVITDPAILAQSQTLFKGDVRLELRQKTLEGLQANLNLEMEKLQPEIAKASLPGPEFTEQMARLNKQLAELQSDQFKKLTAEISKGIEDRQKMNEQVTKQIQNSQQLTEKITKQVQENQQVRIEALQEAMQLKMDKLGDLQEKIGNIQGQLGEIQGKIGEREGLMGEKQGEIGERMGKIGEEMGKIGEQQGKNAEEASRKMKSVIDQAIKDGKAKPID